MYSPKIKPEYVRKMYLLKVAYSNLKLRKPMTEIVREALEQHIPKAVKEIAELGGSLPDELTDN